MNLKFFFYLNLCILFFTFNYVNSQNCADDIMGIWMTPENRSAVQISKMGNYYCGKIIWEKEPCNEKGDSCKDVNNHDPKHRNRLIRGLVIIHGLQYTGSSEWGKGTIYNPEDGNSYKIKAKLENINTLKLRGYIGFSLIGKTSVWKRKK